VPANTKVNVTLYGYDGCTPLRNNYFSEVQGTIGNTVTLSQFDQHGKEYLTDKTTSVINAWSDCTVGHTFAIPASTSTLPVASPNAQLSADNLCSSSPCTPGGNPYARDVQLHEPGPRRRLPLAVPGSPCGGGFLDGKQRPHAALGYMMGEMDVVSS